jgi:hypothetical protein
MEVKIILQTDHFLWKMQKLLHKEREKLLRLKQQEIQVLHTTMLKKNLRKFLFFSIQRRSLFENIQKERFYIFYIY